MIKKIDAFIVKTIDIIFMIIGMLIGLTLIFGRAIDTGYFSYALICIIFFVSFLLHNILKYISARFSEEKLCNRLFFVLLLFFIIFSVIIYNHFMIYPSSDYGAMFEASKERAWNIPLSKEHCIYLGAYPWNYSLLFTYAPLLKIFGANYLVLFGLGLSAMTIAIIFMYLSLREISKDSLLYYEILLFMFLPFYLYTLIAYTTTFAIMFVSIILYIFIKIRRNYTFKNVLFISLIISIGSIYKITVFILGIALIIDLSLQEKWQHILIPLISFIMIRKGFFMFVDATDINFLKTSETHSSILHYFFLGSNFETGGMFSDSDASYIYQLMSKEYDPIRTKTYLDLIQNRFNNKTIIEIVSLYFKKIQIAWTDGLLGAGGALGTKPINYDNINIFFVTGFGHTLVRCYSQIVYVLIMENAFLSSKPNNCISFFVRLSIIGAFFYLLLFETASRYVLQFIPLLIICGSLKSSNNNTSTSK